MPLTPDASIRFATPVFTLVEPSPPWQVKLLNCAGHLEALGEQTSIYGQV